MSDLKSSIINLYMDIMSIKIDMVHDNEDEKLMDYILELEEVILELLKELEK